MRKLFAVSLLLIAAALSPAMAQNETPTEWTAFIERAVDRVIVPAFAELDKAATQLSQSLGALCAAPDENSLANAAVAFADTITAYAQVMVLPIAPVLADNRRERFFFWPDPRGITQRQVETILAEHDATATSLDTLVEKSAALQGLGALEHVLFGIGAESILAADEDGRFRCGYATAIGENLAAIAGAMADEMSPGGPFVAAVKNPGPDNPLFPTADAVIGDLIIAAEDGIELANGSFLVPVLGESAELARPRLAPLWRSGLSFAFLDALVDTTRAFVDIADIGGLLPAESRWIMESVAWELASIAAVELPERGTLDLVASDEEFRRMLQLIVLYTANLKSLIGGSIPEAIGLSAAFFANEG